MGRTDLYLLDTDYEDNLPEDRQVTHQLYGGDWENRLKQELLLGIGGIRALRALGINPQIYHCNEGHAAFIGIERLREFMQDRGLDYNHGTGHGVGYFLNVHEGPASIHLRVGEHPTDSELLREGMVLSDEPGIYREGEYGVRLENLMTVQKGQRTAFGQFLRFETLTMVPFDLEAVDPSALTEREKKLLNDYHREVYQTIAPALNEEEREWLAGATREV